MAAIAAVATSCFAETILLVLTMSAKSRLLLMNECVVVSVDFAEEFKAGIASDCLSKTAAAIRA